MWSDTTAWMDGLFLLVRLLAGAAVLGAAWPSERIASFLFLAAMRVPASGGRNVPLYSIATVSRASVMMSPGGALPDCAAFGAADTAGLSESVLQAAVAVANPATTRSATRVRIGVSANSPRLPVHALVVHVVLD